MKKVSNLKQLKNILELQYILEDMIEEYSDCEYESDKLLIKLQLLQIINGKKYNINTLLSYMKLNEDKFEPFIKMLESSLSIFKRKRLFKTKRTTKNSKDNSQNDYQNFDIGGIIIKRV